MSHANMQKHKKIQACLALFALTSVLVGNEFAFGTQNVNSQQPRTKPSSMQPPATIDRTTSATTIYKSGNYSAVGMYDSPGGSESISVTLTLNNDKVTDASVKSGANDATASLYQSSFIGGYKRYVIGKNISTLKLSNVSGSSLTSQGFNEALKRIQQQAKA